MVMSDEIKEQQNKMKNMNFKSKLNYFWDYYKVHTIAAIIAVVILSIFISDYRESNKECILYALLLNGYPMTDTAELMNEFLTDNGYEPDKVHAYLEGNLAFSPDGMDTSNISMMQKISLMAQAGQLDVIVAGEDITEFYAKQEFFYNLRDILPEDMWKQYEAAGQLVYCETSPTASTLVPVGIRAEAFPRLTETQAYDTDEAPVLSVIVTSPHTENVIQFLKFLSTNSKMAL